MKKQHIIFIVIAALLYVIFHIVTLIYSPLPWYDEISFVSMTESYIKSHTFYEDIRIIAIPEQKLLYGPIYFILQAWVIKTFGFGIFNFRMTGLLCGLIDLFLIWKICKKLGFNVYAAFVTILLVCIEPNFNQFLHSGRMDFTTLFFFLSAYLVFTEIRRDNKALFVGYSLLVGLLLSCAVLTTPRIIFAFASFGFFFIYEIFTFRGNERKAALLKYALIGVAFIGLYYLWVFIAFGNFHNYIVSNFQKSATMHDHIGVGSDLRIRYNLFIYLYSFLAFYLLVKNKLLTKNIHLAILCFPAIVAFMAIVTGGISGRYFSLVTPFTSLLIVGVTVNLLNNKLLKYTTYILCALFGCIFLFKGVYLLSTLPQHDPYANEKIISQYITKNTSMAGNFEFYYIARDNGCSYLSTEENGSMQQQKDFILKNKIKYFIINKTDPRKKEYEEAFLNTNFKLVVNIEDKHYSNVFSRIIKKLPYMITDSYACYIYENVGG